MKRIRITVAYDGTGFCGFQKQPGSRTVEGELDRALSTLTGEDISIIGASRTDSGVHASGNIAVFDTSSPVPAERYPYALLALLPPDLRVMAGDEVPCGWHPRKHKCIKTYRYRIYCGSIEDPLYSRYAAYSRHRLDTERMREAAAYLIGEHDFRSFANPSSQALLNGGSAVREIYSIDIKKSDIAKTASFCGYAPYIVTVTVNGSGFLYNMVRIIAGTLMSTGTGLREPSFAESALRAHDRSFAGPTAPARGLELCSIRYLHDPAGCTEQALLQP